MLLKIRAYWHKKQMRCTRKKVRYNCRQNLAKQRFRHQGRFITKEEMEKLDPDQIYDPNVLVAPKVKQLFRISKDHHRNLSCRSSHSGTIPPVRNLPLLGESNSQATSGVNSNASVDGSAMECDEGGDNLTNTIRPIIDVSDVNDTNNHA